MPRWPRGETQVKGLSRMAASRLQQDSSDDDCERRTRVVFSRFFGGRRSINLYLFAITLSIQPCTVVSPRSARTLHTNHSATSVYDYRDATQIQRLCQDPRFLNSHLSPQAAYECTISRVAGTCSMYAALQLHSLRAFRITMEVFHSRAIHRGSMTHWRKCLTVYRPTNGRERRLFMEE
jgi:hypothetical protein